MTTQLSAAATDDAALAHLLRLRAALAALRASPLAERIRVFGSAARRDEPARVPGDLDVFVDAVDGPDMRVLLRLMIRFWPQIDGFVVWNGMLMCRTPSADGRILSWMPVERRVATLLKAGRAGIPLDAVTGDWLDEARGP